MPASNYKPGDFVNQPGPHYQGSANYWKKKDQEVQTQPVTAANPAGSPKPPDQFKTPPRRPVQQATPQTQYKYPGQAQTAPGAGVYEGALSQIGAVQRGGASKPQAPVVEGTQPPPPPVVTGSPAAGQAAGVQRSGLNVGTGGPTVGAPSGPSVGPLGGQLQTGPFTGREFPTAGPQPMDVVGRVNPWEGVKTSALTSDYSQKPPNEPQEETYATFSTGTGEGPQIELGTDGFFYVRDYDENGDLNWEERYPSQNAATQAVYGDIAAEKDKIPDAYEADVEMPVVKTSGMYQQNIQDLLGDIGGDYANREKHALSVLDQQFNKALNQLGSSMGARGLGTSMAGYGSGAQQLAGSFAQQGSEAVAGLQAEEAQQKLQQLQTLGQMAESQGNLEYKISAENAKNALQAQMYGDEKTQQHFEQRQAAIDGIWSNINNLFEMFNANPALQDRYQAFVAYFNEMVGYMSDPNFTADQLQAKFNELFADFAIQTGANP